MFLLLFFLLFFNVFSENVECSPPLGEPANKPLGKGIGIKPGRVSWYFDKDICSWDGKSEYWWNNENVEQTLLDNAFSKMIINLSGESNIKNAWESIFQYFNKRKYGKKKGYEKGEKIAVKVNLNVVNDYTSKSQTNSLSPQFLKSFLRSIVYNGGVEQKDITIFDPSRLFPNNLYAKPEGIEEEFSEVILVDNTGKGSYIDHQVIPDETTKFTFSNKDIILWNDTLFPKCLNDAKYMIEISNFRGHSIAGVTISGKNWFGSVYRTDYDCEEGGGNFWCPVSLHQFVNVTGGKARGPWLPQRPMGVYNVLVDLMGYNETGGKGLLYLSDALYGGQCQLDTCLPVKFDMQPMNGHWSSSIFASLDPIALDSVLLDFLRSEPNQPYTAKGCTDNYLHEAAQADDPVSGTIYAPSGVQLESLGVHEHWNNEKEKKYSRNLGNADGIDLQKVHEE